MTFPSADLIIVATVNALKSIRYSRFLATERGYHGRFYCALQEELDKSGVLQDGAILEMEYQKSARHDVYERPDIILHIPAEYSGNSVKEGNFAVYALKRHASSTSAKDDFEKLDTMFSRLDYPLGLFLNIDSTRHHLESYDGQYSERIHSFAVKPEGLKIS